MPTKATLKKYGLTLEEFENILQEQNNICPICGKSPTTGKWVIDHEHIRNYKNLSPDKRKAAVRGILCWYCNRWYLAKGITVQKAKKIAEYLEKYEKKKLLND